MKSSFEEDLEKLHKLSKDDYFFYQEYFALVNNILVENNLKIPYSDTNLIKFKHYTYNGCNEVGGYAEDGKKFNVGIPIIDIIEDFFNKNRSE